MSSSTNTTNPKKQNLNKTFAISIKNVQSLADANKLIAPITKQLKAVHPNFDWGAAILHAITNFIPGVDTVHHIVEAVKHGAKWIRKFIMGEPKILVSPPGGPVVGKAMASTRNPSSSAAYLTAYATPKNLNSVTSGKHSVKEYNDSMIKLINKQIKSHEHRSIGLPPNASGSGSKIKYYYDNDGSLHYKDKVKIATIPAATYAAGDIIMAVPILPQSLGTAFMVEAQQFRKIKYAKVDFNYRAICPTAPGLVGIYFDQDPDNTWPLHGGFTELVDIAESQKFKQFPVYVNDQGASTSLSASIDPNNNYWDVSAGSDARIISPGTFYLVAVSNLNVSSFVSDIASIELDFHAVLSDRAETSNIVTQQSFLHVFNPQNFTGYDLLQVLFGTGKNSSNSVWNNCSFQDMGCQIAMAAPASATTNNAGIGLQTGVYTVELEVQTSSSASVGATITTNGTSLQSTQNFNPGRTGTFSDNNGSGLWACTNFGAFYRNTFAIPYNLTTPCNVIVNQSMNKATMAVISSQIRPASAAVMLGGYYSLVWGDTAPIQFVRGRLTKRNFGVGTAMGVAVGRPRDFVDAWLKYIKNKKPAPVLGISENNTKSSEIKENIPVFEQKTSSNIESKLVKVWDTIGTSGVKSLHVQGDDGLNHFTGVMNSTDEKKLLRRNSLDSVSTTDDSDYKIAVLMELVSKNKHLLNEADKHTLQTIRLLAPS